MTLLQQIAQGEGKTLELKRELPRNEHIARTAVAFANTAGGKLVIGVDDQRQIVGVPDEHLFSLLDQITSIVLDRCYPSLLPEIYTTNMNGKLLVVMEVFRGNLPPYYLKKEGRQDGTYLRIGASNRKASALQIIEMERFRSNIGFDEDIYTEQDLQHLDLRSLQSRFALQGKELNEDKLKNLKLVKVEQGKLFPTNGLMILLGQLPHATTKCARFKGQDMGLFLDRKEFAGDLFSQLEQAEAFIKNHIHLRSEIKGLQRTDTMELPASALREALTNAYIHRDYSNPGRDIKVGVYDDIVNIVSPGGFPNTLSQEGFIEGRSEVRNRVIARIFKELGYIEQWGSGLQRIRLSCEAMGLRAPLIREHADSVDVEFYRPINQSVAEVPDTPPAVPDTPPAVPDTPPAVPDTPPAVPDTPPAVPDTPSAVPDTPSAVPDTPPAVPDTPSAVPDTPSAVPDTPSTVPDTLSEVPDITQKQEHQILQALLDTPRINTSHVVHLLSIKERRARNILNSMVEKQMLEKHGNARNTHYVLKTRTE